jgi:hypothetical protein
MSVLIAGVWLDSLLLGFRLGKPRPPTVCLTMPSWFLEIGRLTPNMVGR